MEMSLTLRPAEGADLNLLERWLRQDYVARWVEHPENWLEEFRGRQGEYAWIHHFMGMDGDTPVGFCQYYDCWDAREGWYTANGRGDTFSIDYMIGNADCLGKGYGKAMVRMLTGRVQRTEHPRRIIIQPDPANHASGGVLLANGYVFDKRQGYYCKLFG